MNDIFQELRCTVAKVKIFSDCFCCNSEGHDGIVVKRTVDCQLTILYPLVNVNPTPRPAVINKLHVHDILASRYKFEEHDLTVSVFRKLYHHTRRNIYYNIAIDVTTDQLTHSVTDANV